MIRCGKWQSELREHTVNKHIEQGKLSAQREIFFRAEEDKEKEEEEDKEKGKEKENMKVQGDGNYIFYKYNYGW